MTFLPETFAGTPESARDLYQYLISYHYPELEPEPGSVQIDSGQFHGIRLNTQDSIGFQDYPDLPTQILVIWVPSRSRPQLLGCVYDPEGRAQPEILDNLQTNYLGRALVSSRIPSVRKALPLAEYASRNGSLRRT